MKKKIPCIECKKKRLVQKNLKGRVESLEGRIGTIENLVLHEKSKDLGFAVLKKHLNRKDKPLPRFNGKIIDQD